MQSTMQLLLLLFHHAPSKIIEFFFKFWILNSSCILLQSIFLSQRKTLIPIVHVLPRSFQAQSCLKQGITQLLCLWGKINNYIIEYMYCKVPLQNKNNQEIQLKMVPIGLEASPTSPNSPSSDNGTKSPQGHPYSCQNSPQSYAKNEEVRNLQGFSLEVNKLTVTSLKSSPVSEEPSRTMPSRLNAQKQKFSKIKARQLQLKKKAESIISNSSSNSSPLKVKSSASHGNLIHLHSTASLSPSKLPPGSTSRKEEKDQRYIHVRVCGREQSFRVIRFVDEGCFGKVYLVQHVASSFIFCLKMIDRTFLDETNLDQLVREIKIQLVIEHPNIVHLYAFFVDEAYVYLLLEPCLGGNLFKLMGKSANNCLSEKDAKKYVKEIGKAVDYLHKLNVIHRDIKPENVLLHENSAKLCDFGWAVHSPLMRQTQCGTPLYASPEVIKSEQYDSKIDVWCIGVLTYELLFGEPPFKIRTISDMVKIVDEEVYYPNQIDISWPAVEFMKGCLQKKAVQRFEIRQVLDHQFLLHGGNDRYRNTIV